MSNKNTTRDATIQTIYQDICKGIYNDGVLEHKFDYTYDFVDNCPYDVVLQVISLLESDGYKVSKTLRDDYRMTYESITISWG